MTNDIKENLATLSALQKTDADREAIESTLAGVEARLQALAKELTDFEQQTTESLSQLDTLKKQYRTNEGEVKAVENQILKSQEKLRSVKTNKEYQGMLKEIDELKIKKSALEDQMIEALERIEAEERQARILKADLADLKGEIEKRQEDIRLESDGQREALAAIDQKRERIWVALDPKMQKIYTRAKHQGRGVAVAAVVDSVCQVCRMNIPPQEFIELMRMDTMRMCPNCQRIIYPKALIEDL